MDASPLAEQVIARAARLAASEPGSSLHVVHVVESVPMGGPTVGGAPTALPSVLNVLSDAKLWLARLMSEAQLSDPDTVGHLMVGPAQQQILQLASDLGADSLVVGTHDPGKLKKLLLGSVAESLVRKAPCAVTVVRAKRASHPEVPEILPPCPECVSSRLATGGKTIWCDRHTQHHPPLHAYHETAESFAVGSMTFRPDAF